MEIINNKFIGSNFDDFLKEEGLLSEVEIKAMEKISVFKVNRITNENCSVNETNTIKYGS